MIEALRDRTYMVRHNPNCPKPFEVRLTGRSAIVAFCPEHDCDMFHQARLNDVGHGMTVEEAAENALAAGARRRGASLFRQVWTGDCL